MALTIKNAEAERLARELAAVTGETITSAVTTALRQRLEAGSSAGRRTERLAELRRICADAASRWPAAMRDVEHGELLYDERGLPR